jgi:hypothetical protein
VGLKEEVSRAQERPSLQEVKQPGIKEDLRKVLLINNGAPL